LLSLPLLFSPVRGFPFSEFYHRPQVGMRPALKMIDEDAHSD
jgi:hypothetical protein